VNELAVDVEQGRAVLVEMDDMLVPKFVVECLGTHGSGLETKTNLEA
jgi:hypothetical protein